MKCPIHVVTVEGTGVKPLSFSFRSEDQAKYWFHKEVSRQKATHSFEVTNAQATNPVWAISESDEQWMLYHKYDNKTYYCVNWIETSFETNAPYPDRLDELVGDLVYHVYESCGGDPEDTKLTLKDGVGLDDYELYFYASDLIEKKPDEPEPDDEDDGIDKEVK